MIIDLDTNEFTSLITTLKIPYGGFQGKFAKYSRFSGNQWNEDWSWNTKEIDKMTIEEKFAFYQTIKALK